MHVAIALQNNFPIDNEVRTRKIAKSLSRNGNDVTIFGRNTQHHPAQGEVRETYDSKTEDIGYAVVRRFSFGIHTPIFGYLTIPLPFNPFWFLWMLLNFHSENPDVIIATNIRAGPPAIVAAKLLGIPIVIDLRENFPELAKVLPKDGPFDRISQDPQLVGLLEWFVVTYANQVWVVVEERRDELVARGADRSKLIVVSNTADLSEIVTTDDRRSAKAPARQLEADNNSVFTLIYVGALSQFRGLDRIIEAMPHILEADEDIRLVIGGDGPHRSNLERHSRELGVEDSVDFLGWVDSDVVPPVLKTGDVGVIPHDVNGFSNTTVPNKLFDYMAVKLPVLTTDASPVARIVEQTNSGRIISHDSSPEDVAEEILQLKRSDLQSLGENGHQAVLSRYNWSHEAGRMTEALRQIQNGSVTTSKSLDRSKEVTQ